LNFTEIRRIALEYAKDYPTKSYNITSNLNWFRYVKKIEKIEKIIPKNGKCLEVGCGIGHISAMIKLIRPKLEVIGLDIKSFPTWRKYKKFGCKFLVGNAEKLKLKDSFDIVISFGVMEHTNHHKFLSEIYRTLKKGGYNIIFDLPNKFSFSESFVARSLQTILRRKIFYHEKMYTKKEIECLLKIHNFKILEISREDLIPAQVERVSKKFANFLNKNYKSIDKIDHFLNRTPLNIFCQTYSIICQKD